MRAWKRRASACDSSVIACSLTPGVPKSLLWLPTAMHQRVVAERALRRDLAARRRRCEAATCTSRRCAVESDHLADAVAEVVPVRLRQVVDLVRATCPCCRRRSRAASASRRACALRVDQRDVDAAALAQRVAEPRRELEPAGAAADDDDAVPVRGAASRSWSRGSRQRGGICSSVDRRRRRACATSVCVEHRLGLVGLGVGLVVEHAAACASTSRSPVHLPTTTVATPLPIRLVSARASDMKRSMPRISASPATGTAPTADSVAASTMKPLPVTPAAPLEVSSSTRQQRELLRQRHRRVGGLRDEHRGHRQVDRRAVEVERVAGRARPGRRSTCARRGSRAWPSCAAAPTRTTTCRARSAALP